MATGAEVCGNARVYGNARIYGNAEVLDSIKARTLEILIELNYS